MRLSEMIRLGVHISRVTGRGTRKTISRLTFANWTAEEFRRFQAKNLERLSSNFIIHVGRGVRTMKVGDLPKPVPPRLEGCTLVINRGTKTKML